MLLDDFQPQYDFTEVHTICVKASPEIAFRAILDVTPGEISIVMRLLFFLRSLPEKLANRKYAAMNIHDPMLSSMLNNGFIKLAEDTPHEVVFGMIVPGTIGRVWQKSSSLDLRPANAQEFIKFSRPGCLRVVANLLVKDSDKPGHVIVYTESRTQAFSPQARRDFTPYWRIIRPFSGLIRIVWLKAIKRRAESAQAGE